MREEDVRPLNTAKDQADMACFYAEALREFCDQQGISCVIAISAYDRVLKTEEKRFILEGADTALIGLCRLLEGEVEEKVYDASPPEDDEDDGEDGVGGGKTPPNGTGSTASD